MSIFNSIKVALLDNEEENQVKKMSPFLELVELTDADYALSVGIHDGEEGMIKRINEIKHMRGNNA